MTHDVDDGYLPPTRAKKVEDAFRYDDPWKTVDELAVIVSEKHSEPELEDASPAFAELIPSLIMMLDEQVRNGGFRQFLTNPQGDYWVEIMTALRKVGAAETILLMEQALAVFPDHAPSTDFMTRSGQVSAAGEEAERLLYSLDEPYHAQREMLFFQVKEYLKIHQDEFIDE